MVEPISTALAGLSLLKKSVEFIKSNISTAKDIGEERGIRIVYNTRDHSFSSTSLRNRIAKG